LALALTLTLTLTLTLLRRSLQQYVMHSRHNNDWSIRVLLIHLLKRS
jgi:hypothetical protein